MKLKISILCLTLSIIMMYSCNTGIQKHQNAEIKQSIVKPENNIYYSMATEVRLCVVIPDDHAYGYFYNMTTDPKQLGSKAILLSKEQMYQVLRLIREKHTFAWQLMTAQSPYPKDQVVLLIYGKGPNDHLQCSIGKAKTAAPVLQELVPLLPESSQQGFQRTIDKLKAQIK